MFRNSLCTLVLLAVPACVWAGPTSRPTLKSATRASEPATRPTIDLADLQREWDASLRHVVRARFDAGDRFDTTPAGKAAKAEVAARHRALEEARALRTPQERLEASSAYNKARSERDAARDIAVASDIEVLHALAAADRAKAALDRGKAAMGIVEVQAAATAPSPPPAIHPEYRVESARSVGGMRSINVTFSAVGDAKQVESVLRSELQNSVEKDPPDADVVIRALTENGDKLTTPDGSPGLVFIRTEGQVVTLKNWAARKRR